MNSNEVLYVRSSKKKSKASGDDTSSNESDVWDDTLLIEAYDKAIKSAHSEVLKNMQNSLNKGKDNLNKHVKHEWKIGDHCRCQYSADNVYYEADIIDIMEAIGMCIVKYVGYENEEKIPLQKLKNSKGKTYRDIQIQQALQEHNIKEDEGSQGKDSDSVRHSRTKKKRSNGKKGGKAKCGDSSYFSSNDNNIGSHFNLPNWTMNMSIPPPPPPQMFANFSEGMSETEAMSAMLMSWYMSGYHTGFYQGIKAALKK